MNIQKIKLVYCTLCKHAIEMRYAEWGCMECEKKHKFSYDMKKCKSYKER